MSTLLLIFAMVATWALIWMRYGPLSIMGVGALGMSLYSSPAVVGYMTTPYTSGWLLEPTSVEGTYVMATAWLALLTGLILAPHRAPAAAAMPVQNAFTFDDEHRLKLTYFMWCMAGISVILYLAIAVSQGPLFFLEDRIIAAASAAEIKSFWRWSNALGLLAAVLLLRWPMIGFFTLLVLLYYIAGDRTTITLTLMSLLVLLFRGRRLREILPRPSFALAVASLFVIIIFGKAIYLSIKDGSMEPFYAFWGLDGNRMFFAGFEAFLVHGNLETVIHGGFSYPLMEVVKGTLGQLLIVPSAFGISSQQFNEVFTNTFYSNITFGLAYNYWAEGYSVGAYIGVAVFAFIFCAMLVLADRLERRVGPTWRLIVVLLGVTVGVYIHRNSLENIMVFVRQILMLAVPAAMVAQALVRHRTMSAPTSGRPYPARYRP